MNKLTLMTVLLWVFITVNLLYSDKAINPVYDIAVATWEDNYFGSIKYNKITGESWYLSDNKWKETKEKKKLKKGAYIVKMTSGKESWNAVRINSMTGEAWYLSKYHWIKIN